MKLAGYLKHSKDSGKNFANVTNIQKIRQCETFECLNLWKTENYFKNSPELNLLNI